MSLRKVLVVFFVWLVIAGGQNVWGAVLVVPSAEYPTIQAAVEGADDGDVIDVAPGGYVETVTIANKALVLKGSGVAKIRGKIIVTNATVEIDGFKVKMKAPATDGIVLQGAHESKIVNCYIRGYSGNGILVDSSNDVTIESCVFCSCGTAVSCIASENIHVNYNAINNNDFGVSNVTDSEAGQEVDATFNWWGDSSGPGGVGPGLGDPVSENVFYDAWDVVTEEPRIEITRVNVTDLPNNGHIAYKGDTVGFAIQYKVTGGSQYAKYRVVAKAKSFFGFKCSRISINKEMARGGDFVGPGGHIVHITKKVPRCADDWTVFRMPMGGNDELNGSWVDVRYRVILKDCGSKLSEDSQMEEATYMVRDRYK